MTETAEWFDEKKYSFSKKDIAYSLFDQKEKAEDFIKNCPRKLGWIFQQFLKLYAPLEIPSISENVLVLDADTIFINKVKFFDNKGRALYAPRFEYHKPYFSYAKKVIPGFKRVFKKYSGIAHHMIFQKKVILDLFNVIRVQHKREPWQAFCKIMGEESIYKASLSEYEIYFNCIFKNYTSEVAIRKLKWLDNFDMIRKNDLINYYAKKQFQCISCHSYNR